MESDEVAICIDTSGSIGGDELVASMGELGVPQASMAGYFAHPPRIFLGGYPFGYGNGWDHFHQPNTRMLLNMMSQSDPLFHLGISIANTTNGEVEYHLDVSCTN